MTVRVYGLKTRSVFDGADFFALYDKDKETLGAELVEREEFQLKPGDTRLIDKPVAAGITQAGAPAPVLIVEDFLAEDASQRISKAALAGLGRVDLRGRPARHSR